MGAGQVIKKSRGRKRRNRLAGKGRRRPCFLFFPFRARGLDYTQQPHTEPVWGGGSGGGGKARLSGPGCIQTPGTRRGEGERGDDDEDGRMWDMREEEGEKGFQLGWLEEEEEDWRSRDNLGGIEATAAAGYEKKGEGRKDALAQEEAGKKRITYGDEGVTDKRASSLPLPAFSLSRQ